MDKLSNYFQNKLKKGNVPLAAQNLIPGNEKPTGTSPPIYMSEVRPIIWNWAPPPDVFGEYKPDLTDIVHAYMNQIDTWYGDKPFEIFLNNDSFRAEYGPWVGKFDTNWDLLNWVTGHSQQFLKPLIIDTGNFIVTGKRQIALPILMHSYADYRMMIEKGEKAGNQYVGGEYAPIVEPRFDAKYFNRMSSSEFLLKWLRQPDGVNDFIKAHRMLLGV